METQLLTLESALRELKITLSPSDLAPHYEKAYQKAKPHIQLQGFRKGKVPLNLIKKHYGKAIEADAAEDIATEAFNQYVQEHNISPAGQPRLTDIQRHADGSLGLSIQFEVFPDFELQNYRGLEIEKTIFPIFPEDIDAQIEMLSYAHATLEDAEQISDESHAVTFRFHPIDAATGMTLIGAKSQKQQVFLKNEPADSEIRTLSMNLKTGDSFRVNLPAAEGKDAAPTIMQATIAEIKRVIPAEITDEFISTLTGGEVTTVQELREFYEKNISEKNERLTQQLLEDQIIKKILDAHDVEPPQSFAAQTIISMLQSDIQTLPGKTLPKNFDIRQYAEARMPIATQTSKWFLIRERIIKEENLEITDDDIDAEASKIAASLGISEQHSAALRASIANDEGLKGRILHTKLMKTLLDYSIVTEKEFQPEDSSDPPLAF